MSMTVYGHEIMLQETVGTSREKKSESEHKNRACHASVTDGVDATIYVTTVN